MKRVLPHGLFFFAQDILTLTLILNRDRQPIELPSGKGRNPIGVPFGKFFNVIRSQVTRALVSLKKNETETGFLCKEAYKHDSPAPRARDPVFALMKTWE